MSDLLRPDNVAIFIALFVPGFIIITVYAQFVPVDEPDFTKALPGIIAYSVLHYAVTLWPFFLLPDPGRWVYAYVDVLLLPVLWPVLVVSIRETGGDLKAFFDKRCLVILGNLYAQIFTRRATPTPWEAAFGSAEALWVRVKLKRGGWVGGCMTPGSATSLYPRDKEIYIRDEYNLDQVNGRFQARRQATEGIWVSGSEIEYLRLSRGRKGGQNVERPG